MVLLGLLGITWALMVWLSRSWKIATGWVGLTFFVMLLSVPLGGVLGSLLFYMTVYLGPMIGVFGAMAIGQEGKTEGAQPESRTRPVAVGPAPRPVEEGRTQLEKETARRAGIVVPPVPKPMRAILSLPSRSATGTSQDAMQTARDASVSLRKPDGLEGTEPKPTRIDEAPSPLSLDPIRPGSRGTILIDGSNVAHWASSSRPDLGTVGRVLDELRRRGFAPLVLFDANIGWKTAGREMDEAERARELRLSESQVRKVPGGRQADGFLIDLAHSISAPIVSNDRFRDRLKDDHGLKLFTGMIVAETVLLDEGLG